MTTFNKNKLSSIISKDFKEKYDISSSPADIMSIPFDEQVHVIGMVLSRTGVYVSLPENFKVDEHIANFPPESNGFKSSLKTFDKDKICHLLSLLSSIPASNKDLIVEDGFVPVNAEALNKYMTDYAAYLGYLMTTNVVEWKDDGVYSDGRSRRYRWKEPYFSAKFIKVHTPKYGKLIQQGKIRTVEQFKREVREAVSNYPSYLTYWYNQNRLKLDTEQASNYAFALKNHKLAQGVESWDWNKDKSCPKHPQNQYMAIMENIHSISDENNDYKVLIDDHVHRLHSVLTNMQKDYRNFLTYDNQPLVSIDIKNSQPYLSCVLFYPEFWSNNSTLNLNLNMLPQNIIDSIRFRPPRRSARPITVALNNFFRNLEGHEFDTYKSIVSSGEMYETIMRWIQEETGETIEREYAKTTMFRLFFSPNRTNPEDENHWLISYYKDKFPKVAELFKIIKKQYQGINEEKQHGRLACLLQSVESEIILHRCCKRIWEEGNQQIPVFTIHDSIATTVEHQEYVKGVMEEELTKAIGLEPSLDTEIWHISNLLETGGEPAPYFNPPVF